MKKMNKLVALLLAAVMVLGMMPTMTAHATEYHTHGIEEYPVITLDTAATASVTEGGGIAYFTFTPEATEKYHFYSATNEFDTYGTVYDAEMNYIASNDDSYNSDVATGRNFCITEVLEGGVTYVLAARMYSSYYTGDFDVYVTTAHSYSSSVTQEPTCTEDGVLTYSCDYCDASYDEPIAAGHVYDDDGFCTVCGEEYLITGVCGDDLTWTLDWVGTLTISGTGAMYDYVYSYYGEGSAPWYVAYNYSIKKVVIEEGVTTIGNNAFLYCRNMSEISLPSTLVSIGEKGLSNTGLTSLELPEGLTTLGASALNANYGLTEVELPSTLTSIGDSCFYNCSALTELAIPESVTSIGAYAFYSCGSLKTITLPSTLTAIPDACFGYCSALTTIDWPEALTSIGSNAFYGCSSLGHLVVPEGVTYINQYAFGGGPTKLTLPSTLTELADYALASCWNLSEVFFTGDAPTMGEYTFSYTTTTAWYPRANETWTEDVLQQYGGTITWKGQCAEHDFSSWTTVAATCEVGEYMTRSCTVCGWTENGPEGEPLGHELVTVTHEPDCASYSYGYDEITCTREGCNYYSTENWVYPDHKYETVVVEATCTEGGYTTMVCSSCNYENYWYRSDYTDALGHNVEEWSEPSELTCEEDSVKTGTCTVCNETVTEVVEEAVGHIWDEENPVENEDGSLTYSCTACGATYSTESPYLHLGDNEFSIAARTDSASKTFTAEETGTLTIAASDMYYVNYYGNWTTLAIDWAFSGNMFSISINDAVAEYTVEGSETAAKIITSLEVQAGDVVTVTLNHNQANSYYFSYNVKLNMNLTLVPDHTHSYEAVVTEPTCTEYGFTTYVCECGDSYVDEDSWTEPEHKWDDGVVTEPTCTEQGYTTFTCSACGESYVDEDSYTDALGHSWKGTGCENCDATRENPFTDVPEDSWYIDPVLWAVENGITTGASATTFNPNGNCLRAQVVTFLWRAAGEPEPTTTENPFDDVTESDWYYKAVLWAVENEITNGTSATTFSPTDNCNRAAVVTFLYRAMGEPEVTSTENPFNDVDVTAWYGNAILWAVENGVTDGMGDGSFGINGLCNRAQVVTFLYRAYN